LLTAIWTVGFDVMIPVRHKEWRTPERVLSHVSWPLHDLARHFDLGYILSSEAIEAVPPATIGALSAHHAGCWECNLADDSLTWSGGVYDIFGLGRNARITRDECVSLYSESSRVILERLRSEAIRNRNGFTLDAEIHTVSGESRWMRLIAAPIFEDGRVARLQGVKLIIS
jgi:PAS domain-containing protein